MNEGRIWSGVFPSKRRSCISVRSTTAPGMRFSIPISSGRMSCFSARSVDISATCSRLRYANAGSFLSIMSAIGRLYQPDWAKYVAQYRVQCCYGCRFEGAQDAISRVYRDRKRAECEDRRELRPLPHAVPQFCEGEVPC